MVPGQMATIAIVSPDSTGEGSMFLIDNVLHFVKNVIQVAVALFLQVGADRWQELAQALVAFLLPHVQQLCEALPHYFGRQHVCPEQLTWDKE